MIALLSETDPSSSDSLVKQNILIPSALVSKYKCELYDLRSESIYFRRASYLNPPKRKIEIAYQNDYIQFLYLNTGKHLSCQNEDNEELFNLNRAEFAIFKHHKDQNRFIQLLDSEKTEINVINIKESFFNKIIENSDALKGVFKEIGSNFFSHIIINHEIFECLNKLCAINENDAGFNYAYLEIKAQELILLSLNQYSEQYVIKNNALENEIYEKMMLVSEHLNTHIEYPHSLKELSALICSNTSYLKLNFKKVFNQSVFEFLNAIRMQKAKEILQCNKQSIAETANQIGYKHATHFTAAFKKYYGFLPSAVKLG